MDEYTGMATLNHAFYVIGMGEPEGIALPSMTSDTRMTATDAPASFTTGTDPDDMFQDAMPPDHL
ncbi:hypothetical protein ACFVXW_27185 [Streptomyces sp. NPDC058251]|uniref:hypothetical protein n=1 Tax=unclassified Streptomyces TaxID=2593676 RepID=UPI00365ED724